MQITHLKSDANALCERAFKNLFFLKFQIIHIISLYPMRIVQVIVNGHKMTDFCQTLFLTAQLWLLYCLKPFIFCLGCFFNKYMHLLKEVSWVIFWIHNYLIN